MIDHSAKPFFIEGPSGKLEALETEIKPEISSRQATAIICHPHPLFGGTMNNKVVSTLARAFSNLGFRTIRFNFRGVGQSEGHFDEGVGELEDLQAVIAWVKLRYPEEGIALSGFSFGAAISARAAATLPDCLQLVSIAPPVPRFGLPSLEPIACPWLVVQGDQDDVVLPEDVYAWIETRNPKPKLIRFEKAGHFFHGQLTELREALEETLLA
jgi:uncharacterized protein